MSLSTSHNGKQQPISDLHQLAKRVAELKAQGHRIVHCHGVFDLLHIGHIRHFRAARQYGDVLVVTLTPDRFVNKGPHRPAFPQALRAEAVAALDCVDYVAVNEWPTAVEAIELLRPDAYVKGSDYREAEKDRTGGISQEQQAVEKVGGELVFTDDITFSSSNLINQHLSPFSPAVKQYLEKFATCYSYEDISRYLDALRPLRALVVGEAIVDEYLYCEAIGKSSKEPTLAVRHLSTERFAGGSVAIANHLANFCDSVGLLTTLGSAHPHEEFLRERILPNVEISVVYRANCPTVLKRRFIESYFFTKMFEVYEMDDRAMDDDENQRLCTALSDLLPRYDVVIAADFGHGMISREAVKRMCDEARFLAVNAQSNAANLGYHAITKYPRADYICLTEGELRLEARDRQSELRSAMLGVASNFAAQQVSVTRGNKGCLVYSPQGGFFDVPAFAGKVVDRVGAGDAFLAITSLCVASGVPPEAVGFIGNAVGAQAVTIVGNSASIQRVPLYKHIESILK